MANLIEQLQLTLEIKNDFKAILEDYGIDTSAVKFAEYPFIIRELLSTSSSGGNVDTLLFELLGEDRGVATTYTVDQLIDMLLDGETGEVNEAYALNLLDEDEGAPTTLSTYQLINNLIN